MKTQLKISDVINVNAPCMLKNWITNYFWDKKPIQDSYFESKDYYVYKIFESGIEADLTYKQREDLIDKWVQKAKVNCKFIYLSEKQCDYSIKSFKDFCKEYSLPFKTIADMQNFISSNFNVI